MKRMGITLVKNWLLVKRYPFLRVTNQFTGQKIGLEVTWYDQIPEHWRKRFGMQMIRELRKILVKYDYLHNYSIGQIKEKYGSLRWYDNGYCGEMSKEYHEWLEKYETASTRCCFFCGNDSHMFTRGWILPICDKCDLDKKVGKGWI
jgi:hypothetical protein